MWRALSHPDPLVELDLLLALPTADCSPELWLPGERSMDSVLTLAVCSMLLSLSALFELAGGAAGGSPARPGSDTSQWGAVAEAAMGLLANSKSA